MRKEEEKYEEWLTTLSNTRFIYNTMAELEEMLDIHSIHSNGIRRSLPSSAKQRAVFRDLKEQVRLMTDSCMELDVLLNEYSATWRFYREHLSRRKNPEKMVEEILSYAFPPHTREGIPAQRRAIYQAIEEQSINIPILILLLLKALPGYDSKEGDVTDMPIVYERVMKTIEQLTAGKTLFQRLPAIERAREEDYKNRIMLIHHLNNILNTYDLYAEENNLYDAADVVKERNVTLDIDGYWNSTNGELLNTDFWRVKATENYGTYFATHYKKNAENRLESARYTISLMEDVNGELLLYVIHPEAIAHFIKEGHYQESDHTWYRTMMPSEHPDHLELIRTIRSTIWPDAITLTRCEKEDILQTYEKWLNDLTVISPYQHCEYNFSASIHAITMDHIYILNREGDNYYKVPRDAAEGLERIGLHDAVGILEMGGKEYLAFDELMLYLPITPKTLKKYGIEIVTEIQ